MLWTFLNFSLKYYFLLFIVNLTHTNFWTILEWLVYVYLKISVFFRCRMRLVWDAISSLLVYHTQLVPDRDDSCLTLLKTGDINTVVHMPCLAWQAEIRCWNTSKAIALYIYILLEPSSSKGPQQSIMLFLTHFKT